jgi:hypothetical protein
VTRQTTFETEVKPRRVRRTTYACDGCGRPISPEDDGDGYANDLAVALNQNECVSFYRLRDYCTKCLEPIWQGICKLINSDPDLEGSDPEDA